MAQSLGASPTGPWNRHQYQPGSSSRCASCIGRRVGMGAGAAPHPALRATFPLRAFQGGYFHRIPRRSSLRLSPPQRQGSAGEGSRAGTWTSPALLLEAARKFKAMPAPPSRAHSRERASTPSFAPPAPHPHPHIHQFLH